MYFSLLILHAWYIWYPSENKTSLRHLRIVFKSSYLGKAYVRCLQENLIENNVNVLIKCLRKTWNRRLNQMSTSDVSKTSFKDVLKMDFFNFREKSTFHFTSIYLLLAFFSKCWVLFIGHKVVTTFSLRHRCSINVLTTLCFRCLFWDQVSTLEQRCIFDVVSLTKI